MSGKAAYGKETWDAFLGVGHEEKLQPILRPFVEDELGLTWPWLTQHLTEAFLRHALSIALGVSVGSTIRRTPTPPPPVDVSYSSRSWASVDEAINELFRVFREALTKLQAAQPRIGLRRTEHLEDWGRWFYRHRVKQPADSIAQLSREYVKRKRSTGTTIGDDQRRTVRDGITQGAEILNLKEARVTGPIQRGEVTLFSGR